MTPQARNAIAYCNSIGAAPYEMVRGKNDPKGKNDPPGPSITMPRWQWYIGAVVNKPRKIGEKK